MSTPDASGTVWRGVELSAETERSTTALRIDDSTPSRSLGLKPSPLYPVKGFHSGEDELGINPFPPNPLLEREPPRELVGLQKNFKC